MLVVSRKVEEELVIDGRIVVKITGLKANGAVRIGIVAPASVEVHRGEVYDRQYGIGSVELVKERAKS